MRFYSPGSAARTFPTNGVTWEVPAGTRPTRLRQGQREIFISATQLELFPESYLLPSREESTLLRGEKCIAETAGEKPNRRGLIVFAAFLQPWKAIRLPAKQILRLAVQRGTQTIQDCTVERFRSVVKPSMQRGVGNSRFLLQSVTRPALPLENVLQCTCNHNGRLH